MPYSTLEVDIFLASTFFTRFVRYLNMSGKILI